MKIFKSIVDERILHDFSKIQGRSLMNYVANSSILKRQLVLLVCFVQRSLKLMIVYLFLNVNGEEIITTVDHPFFVKNQGN